MMTLWMTSLPKSMSICEHPYGVLDRRAFIVPHLTEDYREIWLLQPFLRKPLTSHSPLHICTYRKIWLHSQEISWHNPSSIWVYCVHGGCETAAMESKETTADGR